MAAVARKADTHIFFTRSVNKPNNMNKGASVNISGAPLLYKKRQHASQRIAKERILWRWVLSFDYFGVGFVG